MTQAGCSPSIACPVAPLAQEAQRLMTRMSYFELRDPPIAKACEDRLADLEAAARHLDARSELGALFLALLAAGEIEVVGSWLEGEQLAEARAGLGIARRLLVGIVRALRSPAAQVLVDYYLGSEFVLEAMAA